MAFYFNTQNNKIHAKSITESSPISSLMTVDVEGNVQLKGVKQVDVSLTNRFKLTNDGNLIAPGFETEI